MILKEREGVFLYIPPVFEKEIQEEIMSFYRVFSADQTIPCLDETVVNRIGFYYMAICHYYDSEGEVIDGEWITQGDNWDFLTSTYPIEERSKDFLKLRTDIKRYMDMHSLVYEENWLFSLVQEKYERTIHNAPLQEVW